jgi:Holliday junction DNA helicase RuvA
LVIAQLTGSIVEAAAGRIVLDVAGVGYELLVPATQFGDASNSKVLTVFTVLIVREDAHTLFGFEDRISKSLFLQLNSVTGVGPKSALAVLSQLGADDISRAITSGNDAIFKSVSGIGPKTAKLICITLAGKVHRSLVDPTNSDASVVEALVGLGWQEAIADKAVAEVLASNPDLNSSALLKIVLASASSAKVQ